MSDIIEKYFPQLTAGQKEKFSMMRPAYEEWNNKINVISRKDMDDFYLHHVLHSLAIAKIISFAPGTHVLDAGTGGGFPGIPLAILFPDTRFVLMDSITKKIMVVEEIARHLSLSNVEPVRSRVEEHKGRYHFIVSRAVTAFPDFVRLTTGKISRESFNSLRNGILYLKGGDLEVEILNFKQRLTVYNINTFFSEPFFETKRILYLRA